MKIHIKGMLTDRKKIQYDLYISSKQVAHYIVKLIQFPDAAAKNHWVKEIYACLSDVHKLKGSNKLPSAKFIYREISAHNDMLPTLVSYIRDEEPDEIFHYVGPYDCLQYLEEYEHWLANNLSVAGYVTLFQVKQKLTEMGLLYM